MGLENSEHIQNILIDPGNSNVVYVSAIGPLWAAGGDRGLYKTTDRGQTWKAVLSISPDTGVTDVVMDPKKPDTFYAAALQRRRAVGQLIGGGPESAIYKTTDGGAKWTKLTKGLPSVEMVRASSFDGWMSWNVASRHALLKNRLTLPGRALNRRRCFVLVWSRRRASATGWRHAGRRSPSRPEPR